jgi:hypothetical protein
MSFSFFSNLKDGVSALRNVMRSLQEPFKFLPVRRRQKFRRREYRQAHLQSNNTNKDTTKNQIGVIQKSTHISMA